MYSEQESRTSCYLYSKKRNEETYLTLKGVQGEKDVLRWYCLSFSLVCVCVGGGGRRDECVCVTERGEGGGERE